jgi:hypothetical protein
LCTAQLTSAKKFFQSSISQIRVDIKQTKKKLCRKISEVGGKNVLIREDASLSTIVSYIACLLVIYFDHISLILKKY